MAFWPFSKNPKPKKQNETADQYFAKASSWQRVVSSRVESAAYWTNYQNVSNGVLALRFPDGAVYWYYDVSQTTFNQFISSYSKGRFVYLVLDHHYYARHS